MANGGAFCCGKQRLSTKEKCPAIAENTLLYAASRDLKYFVKHKNYIMTLEELKQDDWYKERPLLIQQAIEILPPIQLYKFKNSGKQCYIQSFEEPESGKLEDVTVTVQKTGVGGAMVAMGMGALDTNAVFGLSLDDLEPWID